MYFLKILPRLTVIKSLTTKGAEVYRYDCRLNVSEEKHSRNGVADPEVIREE